MTWIASGTLLGIILSFWWAYSRSLSFEVKMSRKGQFENFGFGRRDTCFWGQFFVKNAKNDRRTLWTAEIEKFGKSEKCKNRWKYGGKWSFSTFKMPKLGHFPRYLVEILYTCKSDRALSHIFRVFWKFENVPHFLTDNIFFDYFLQYSFFQNLENPR